MTLSSILADEEEYVPIRFEHISKAIQPCERPASGRHAATSSRRIRSGSRHAGKHSEGPSGSASGPREVSSAAARRGASPSRAAPELSGTTRSNAPSRNGTSLGADHGRQDLDMSCLLTSLRGWEVSDSLAASHGEGIQRGLDLGGTLLVPDRIDEEYGRLQRDDHERSPPLTPRSSGKASSCSSRMMGGLGLEEEDVEEELSREQPFSIQHESPPGSRRGLHRELDTRQELGTSRDWSSAGVRLASKAQDQPVLPQCLQELMDAPGPTLNVEPEPAVAEPPNKEHFTTYVRAPGFPGTDRTVAFSDDAKTFVRDGLQPITKKIYVRFGGIANSPVKNALKMAGIRRIKSSGFNLFWTAALGRDSPWWKVLNKYQRVNHFPGTWELGRKDKLYKNVAAMRRNKGSEFDFVPRFFILPREMEDFQQDIERNPSMLYIQKPLASSRGRGIKMVVKPKEMPKDSHCLVQRYIRDPLTIDGYKFDIRLYCVVTCFDPLKVYLYHDGLVRFATEKYSNNPSHLKKRCVHLTNYSVNKKKEGFVDAEEGEDGVGFKWSFDPLRSYLEERGIPWSTVWDQMRAIVAKTIIAVEPKINTLVKMVVPHRNICFEIYGFDIMLDSNMKASLIEVNTGPSLGATTPIDRKVKFPLLGDLLNLIGIVPYDKASHEREAEMKRAARLTGLGDQESRIRHRDIREAQEYDFGGYAPDELPEIVREAEAELTRRGGFHRVFPVPEDPCRYLDLFEAPRYDTTLVCRYYEQKNSGFPGIQESGMRRNGSRRTLMSRTPSSTSISSSHSKMSNTVSRTPSTGSLISNSATSVAGSARLKSSRAKLPPYSSRNSRPTPSSTLPPAGRRRTVSQVSSLPRSTGAMTDSSLAFRTGSARRARSPMRDTDSLGQSRRSLSSGRPLLGGRTESKNKGRVRTSSKAS